MEQNKKFVVHLDILGFDQQAKQVEKIHGVPSWRARKNVIEKVDNILNAHIKGDKYAKKTSSDSWMVLFDSINSVLEYLKNVKQSMEKEYNLISLETGVTYGNIECDEFWLTDEAIEAVNICKKYRELYRSVHNDFPRTSFTLIHATAYKELDVLAEKFGLPTGNKIDKLEVRVYDPSLYNPPHENMVSFNEFKKEKEDIEKLIKVEKAQISLYDPAHLGDTFEKLIKGSKNIDLYLYTTETFAITYREILKKHQGVSIRILTIHPDYAEEKRTAVSNCIELWNEIYSLNRNCKISIKLYAHPPSLRGIIFDKNEGFLGIYKYDPNHHFRFVGVENNKLIHAKRDTEFGRFILDLYENRFEYEWENSKKIELQSKFYS